MGFLFMLLNLGHRHPVLVLVLSVPDTDDLPSVRPFHFSHPTLVSLLLHSLAKLTRT